MDQQEFRALAAAVDRTGRWPADDRRGALNFLTPQAVSAALATAVRGTVISCADWPRTSEQPRFDLERGIESAGSWLAVNETISYQQHGASSMTHLDALGHFFYDGRGFAASTQQDTPYDVTGLSDGIVGRGLLLDLPRCRGVAFLEPGALVTIAEVRRWLAETGTEPCPGDVMFVRTGRPLAPAPPPGGYPLVGGLDLDCATWVHDSEFSLIVSDNGLDTLTPVVADVATPWHVLTLARMGVPLVDMADLERLAATCQTERRQVFLASVAAMPLPGASASTVNPLAVF